MTEHDTSPLQNIKYPHWQREFEAAQLEGDSQTLWQRVDAAEAAIFLRLQALVESAQGHAEQQAISDAIRTLRTIQRCANYLNWSRFGPRSEHNPTPRNCFSQFRPPPGSLVFAAACCSLTRQGSNSGKLFLPAANGFYDNLRWLLGHRNAAVISIQCCVYGELTAEFSRTATLRRGPELATNPVSLTDERHPPALQYPAGMDDISLMEKLTAGDQNALMALYDRYSPLVYALSLHVLRNRQSAEDVVQEVFLRVWRKPSSYNPASGSLVGWLTVMARYQAIDSLRRKQKELQLAEAVVPINARRPKVADSSGDLAPVRSILEKLPVEQREVLALAYFTGLTPAEIANQTGQPLGTAKTQIRLALQSLRRLLHDEGGRR